MATKKLTYRRFTENNDYEGERWHFYIPIKNNEDALQTLAKLIKAANKYLEKIEECPLPIELSKNIFSSSEVDTLVKYTEHGYMAQHQQLEGKLIIPNVPKRIDEKNINWFNDFYKGGIYNFIKRNWIC